MPGITPTGLLPAVDRDALPGLRPSHGHAQASGIEAEPTAAPGAGRDRKPGGRGRAAVSGAFTAAGLMPGRVDFSDFVDIRFSPLVGTGR